MAIPTIGRLSARPSGKRGERCLEWLATHTHPTSGRPIRPGGIARKSAQGRFAGQPEATSGGRQYLEDVDVLIDVVEPSLTAVVVVEPMDLSRIMDCFNSVYGFLRSGTEVRQTGQNIALYENDRRMEIGVEVDRAFDALGSVVSSSLPGGRIAHAAHTTGYADLGRTYRAISDWCQANDEETAGVQWEIYSDPNSAGHVDVEICYLLR